MLSFTARQSLVAAARLPVTVRTLATAASGTTGTGDYDVVVIGGGPGGYVAAIKAAQLGLKVYVREVLSWWTRGCEMNMPGDGCLMQLVRHVV